MTDVENNNTTELTFLSKLSDEAIKFLEEHDVAVLSSVDSNGNVYGAAVYYLVDNYIYIMTKSGTAKAHNILGHAQVALTVFEASSAQTLQLSGHAELEPDQRIKDRVFKEFVKPRSYKGNIEYPPVTKLTVGSFMIIRITPTAGKYTDYKKLQQ